MAPIGRAGRRTDTSEHFPKLLRSSASDNARAQRASPGAATALIEFLVDGTQAERRQRLGAHQINLRDRHPSVDGGIIRGDVTGDLGHCVSFWELLRDATLSPVRLGACVAEAVFGGFDSVVQQAFEYGPISPKVNESFVSLDFNIRGHRHPALIGTVSRT
jgi:hypothetical protein